MWRLHEKIMFAPTHKGPTPPPIYEQGPSSAGLILGLAGTAVDSFGVMQDNTAPDIWSGGGSSTASSWSTGNNWSYGA